MTLIPTLPLPHLIPTPTPTPPHPYHNPPTAVSDSQPLDTDILDEKYKVDALTYQEMQEHAVVMKGLIKVSRGQVGFKLFNYDAVFEPMSLMKHVDNT